METRENCLKPHLSAGTAYKAYGCRCIPCVAQNQDYQNKWRRNNKDKHNALCQKWKKANPEALRRINQKSFAKNYEKIRDRELRKRYGITNEDFSLLLTKQNGVCAICKRTDGTKKYLSVDHCHTTGKVRGLLCSGCNKGIGLLNDSCALLESAKEYLSA